MTTQTTRLLTRQEVAKLLQVNVRLVWRLTKSGELPYIMVGRFYRYDAAEVQAFIERSRRRNGGGGEG